LRLTAIAVDALAGHPMTIQELCQTVGPVLGASKDEGVGDLPAPQKLEQQVGLEVVPNRVDRLGDAHRRC
jgi:hypothetical protein